MNLHRKDQAQAQGASVASYAPIAQTLSSLPEDERKRLRAKFDIAYFVAIEQLAYRKYPRICELEARHGVNVTCGVTVTSIYDKCALVAL